MPFISCNYCMKKGHVIKNFYARKYDVLKGDNHVGLNLSKGSM